ncbi:pantetheine-phosphate adenylyltransferase [Amedibacterium intestinale]|uniref:pantetheine-phosphate adenylyltransferase n=1 Tax=Amedibacterium intestinale TaxID=2583452 RepID=UPI000E4E32D6|nr:pantetheine-phosphate adenylyltransferase [Amedibacterium intestinale]RHO20851.1 pantetheine-phosphate adenylyltransferase [Eubacterium sp. AM18-26]RHO24823.1 pantetheine-phosphate adenylyltransferase [Eubacterium sp. AM18-10LB-B]
MTKAIFPGSFDPLTMGHMNIIERACKIFDEVIVIILENSEKRALFDLEERLHMIKSACAHLSKVSVMSADTLTVEAAKTLGANVIIRGVRSIKDFEYEKDIASVNHHLDQSIETILLYTDECYGFVSSSVIKELLKYGKDINGLVPEAVHSYIQNKF